MGQLMIDLPDNLEVLMRTRLQDAEYSGLQQYVRGLIESGINEVGISPPERVMVRSLEELEAKLMAGLNSGPSQEMTAADWAERRRRLTEKYSKRTTM